MFGDSKAYPLCSNMRQRGGPNLLSPCISQTMLGNEEPPRLGGLAVMVYFSSWVTSLMLVFFTQSFIDPMNCYKRL